MRIMTIAVLAAALTVQVCSFRAQMLLLDRDYDRAAAISPCLTQLPKGPYAQPVKPSCADGLELRFGAVLYQYGRIAERLHDYDQARAIYARALASGIWTCEQDRAFCEKSLGALLWWHYRDYDAALVHLEACEASGYAPASLWEPLADCRHKLGR